MAVEWVGGVLLTGERMQTSSAMPLRRFLVHTVVYLNHATPRIGFNAKPLTDWTLFVFVLNLFRRILQLLKWIRCDLH